MNDYSINFDEEEYADNHEHTVNVKGRYNRANFAANSQFSSVDKIKASLNSGTQLWDIPCIRETFIEDNDTQEEDEEDEDAEPSSESSKLLDMLSSMLTDRRATLKDIRKGFIFFIDQEKKDIKRHIAIQRAQKIQSQTEEVDAPKEWWEDEQMYRPISEWTL